MGLAADNLILALMIVLGVAFVGSVVREKVREVQAARAGEEQRKE